ncbi:MAG: PspA/IM30 family protein [Xanthomonadales bacterium]|jgi:phage shock protein A|nr:PspA/IM30 family protein [Xanthomonadales bacterium]
MGTFSRLRYVIAANVNALIEKAEDPEKLLRALIREMEDASEEARMACADLLAEQQRLQRLETRLGADRDEWQSRAEKAVTRGRDDLARTALKARSEISDQLEAARDEQARVGERVEQMEQDMATLKVKLAEAKTRLKSMQKGRSPRQANAEIKERLTPGERRIRRAMDRFEHLQNQVDSLEARVRSYEVGGAAVSAWEQAAGEPADPVIEDELSRMKERLAKSGAASGQQRAEEAGA